MNEGSWARRRSSSFARFRLSSSSWESSSSSPRRFHGHSMIEIWVTNKREGLTISRYTLQSSSFAPKLSSDNSVNENSVRSRMDDFQLDPYHLARAVAACLALHLQPMQLCFSCAFAMLGFGDQIVAPFYVVLRECDLPTPGQVTSKERLADATTECPYLPSFPNPI